MHIAIEGCCHGELDKIYETLQYIEKREEIEIELLLCCGDFQSVRNESDLRCMAVPDKHKSMQDFWQYYSGKKKAPFLTIFIGGNHEASNYLQELPYGGWVAPNIYYLGYAGVVNYKGLRIGGLSGIFKQHDYTKGRYEKPPYSDQTKRSVYHVRNIDVFRLKQLKQPVDIMMSHDWPRGIVHHGNKEELIRVKWHFEEDIRTNQLGSLPSWQLLSSMKPKYWFSGHLHVKFPALVKHEAEYGEEEKVTKFLALDKCLPRRDFLQVLNLPTPDNATNELLYDSEWLAVLKETNNLTSISHKSFILPTKGLHEKWDYSVNEQKQAEVMAYLGEDLNVPLNFRPDEKLLYNPEQHFQNRPVQCIINQQTTELCAKLEINDPLMLLLQQSDLDAGGNISLNNSSWLAEDEMDEPSAIISNASINPDEIDVDDDDDIEETSQEASTSDDMEKDKVLIDVPPGSPDVTEEDSAMASSLSSMSEEESTASLTKKGMRSSARPPIIIAANFSMNLPAPIIPLASTPSRGLPKDSPDEPFSPISTSDSDSQPRTLAPGIKRLSDTDSEFSEISAFQSTTKKFKRRNASFYSGQSGEDTS